MGTEYKEVYHGDPFQTCQPGSLSHLSDEEARHHTRVKQAEDQTRAARKALKVARKAEQQRKEQAKAAAKKARQRQKLADEALRALKEIAADRRPGSTAARLQAVEHLYHLGTGESLR